MTLLMLVAQQVIHRLHGVERAEGHFDEHGAPVAHRAVPQAGQLKGLEFLAGLRLRGDESRGLVDEIRQVEGPALVVLDGAYQVDGVEVSALCEHLHVGLVISVDLAALEYLERYGAVLVVGQEWSAAGLAHVLHHAAHAHRAVQLAAQVVGIHLIILRVGAEAIAHEFGYLYQLRLAGSAVEHPQILECLLLQGDENAGNDLLPLHGLGLQAVGHHVVDVLDEYHVGLNLVQVLDKGAMASRAEEQRAVVVAEGRVVGVGGVEGFCSEKVMS